MNKEGQGHTENSSNKNEKYEEAASDMFELVKHVNPDSTVGNDRQRVGDGLSRFKSETGVDFLDLLSDKQLRANFLVGSGGNRDTDEDELIIQKFFEPAQKKLLRSND